MPKIGNSIRIIIRGPWSASDAFNIGKDSFISMRGKIIEDQGKSWLVELNISVNNRNRMLVPKVSYSGDINGYE